MTNPLYHKHIISINDLNRDDLESVLHVADKLKQHPNSQLLKDKVIASCFFEASTPHPIKKKKKKTGKNNHGMKKGAKRG